MITTIFLILIVKQSKDSYRFRKETKWIYSKERLVRLGRGFRKFEERHFFFFLSMVKFNNSHLTN